MYKIKYYLWIFGLAVCLCTDAYSADNTNIHTTVNTELLTNTSSCDTSIATGDCDGDGLNNGEENTGVDDPATPATPICKSNPNDACSPPGQDVSADCDNDGIANSQEILDGTDPDNPCDPPGQNVDVDADCDGDGFTNHNELIGGTNPSDPCDFPGQDTEKVDCDGDGLTTEEENTGVDDENTIAIPDGTSIPTDRCSPAISNNTKPSATTIDIGADCHYGFNVCAYDETNPSSCGYSKSSVWYKFEVTTQGYYEIRTSSASFNHALTLFSGTSEIACTNSEEVIFREHLYESLSPNTYYIMVTGVEDMTEEESMTQGVFCIEVNMITDSQIPDNQYCADDVPSIPLNTECSVTGSNKYASYADPLPSCNPYAGASVWYKFQTPSPGKVKISAVVNYSEVISVYEGTCGSLTEITCKLNGTDDSDDLITKDLLANTIYYLQISGNFTSIEANNTDCNEGYITISTNPSCEIESCNDYNPNTINDMWDANCNCTGDCPSAGDICDDGNDQTINDTFGIDDCNCTPECTIGESCDDGNSETTNDRWTTDATSSTCICLGTIPGACLEDIIVNANNVSDGLFEASNSIETSGTVAVNSSLELNAGAYIKLKPGFSSTGEAYFHGWIEGCTPVEIRAEEEVFFAAVKHYPNPFRDEVNLEFTLDFDAEVQVIVSDVNGRTVAQLPAQNIYSGTQTINLSTQNWIAGIYFYQALITEQNTGILKRTNGTLVKM